MGSVRMRVKMCGMTCVEDIEQAIALGVDAIGLIFYPESARYVSVRKAKDLLKNIAPFVDVVAVLVNPEQVLVEQIIKELPVQFLQFHGDESAEFCDQFAMPFIKTIHPKSTEHIIQQTKEYAHACAILLDTPSDTHKGGTGVPFDWKLIPQHLPKPYILAGGLNEATILEAMKCSKPYAVDLCSGIERVPGIKDPVKMAQFIKILWGR